MLIISFDYYNIVVHFLKVQPNNVIIIHMPMEEWVKCLSPHNTFGVSGVNSVAAKSNTIKVNGDSFFKRRITGKITKMPPYCCCGVVQVSTSTDIYTITITIITRFRLKVLWYLPLELHSHSHAHTGNTKHTAHKLSPKGTRGVCVSIATPDSGLLG